VTNDELLADVAATNREHGAWMAGHHLGVLVRSLADLAWERTSCGSVEREGRALGRVWAAALGALDEGVDPFDVRAIFKAAALARALGVSHAA
jgi:hypothetical protein